MRKAGSYFEINQLVERLLELKSFDKSSVLMAVLSTPTFEIVRCEDCKHYRVWGGLESSFTCAAWTDQWDMPTMPDGYCHLGELKNEN